MGVTINFYVGYNITLTVKLLVNKQHLLMHSQVLRLLIPQLWKLHQIVLQYPIVYCLYSQPHVFCCKLPGLRSGVLEVSERLPFYLTPGQTGLMWRVTSLTKLVLCGWTHNPLLMRHLGLVTPVICMSVIYMMLLCRMKLVLIIPCLPRRCLRSVPHWSVPRFPSKCYSHLVSCHGPLTVTIPN